MKKIFVMLKWRAVDIDYHVWFTIESSSSQRQAYDWVDNPNYDSDAIKLLEPDSSSSDSL